MKLVTSREPSALRPSSARSSMRKAKPTISAPRRSSSRPVAASGAAGREQVVDDQDPLAPADRVGVDLERVGAVLERVFFGVAWRPEACRACAPGRSRRRAHTRAARRACSRAPRCRRRTRRRALRKRSTKRSIVALKPAGSLSSGVMSRNRIPGIGKSGMARISDSTCSFVSSRVRANAASGSGFARTTL